MAPVTFDTVDDLPPVATVAEVAALLSCAEFTVRQMIRRGDLPHVRLGRLVKIPRDGVKAFLTPASGEQL